MISTAIRRKAGTSFAVLSACALLLALVTGGAFSPPPVSAKSSPASLGQAPILLPIEVLGRDGLQEEVVLDVQDPSAVDRLYLRVHSPVYRDVSVNPGRGPKASVRMNGGPWIGLTNQTVDVYAHEAAYGGLNGTYHTVRMTIPVAALGGVRAGANTLSFRFNGTDGVTVGYRVIDLNLLRRNGSRLLPDDAFVDDDPASWSPPLASAADIQKGEELWRTARIVDHPGGSQIRATCSGCHARDGRDLWYYGYSNQSIVARSEFHGLSRTEAEQIASYVRSLQNSDPSFAYKPPGRPWNPPFQPGPGLDSKPAHEWAAGAGLEWVLETDNETYDHLVGVDAAGKPTTAPVALLHPQATLNRRETSLAIQFPDWNEWLPDVHPVDMFGAEADFEATEMWHWYAEARQRLTNDGAAALIAVQGPEDLAYVVSKFVAEVSKFRTNSGGLIPAYTVDEVGYERWRRSVDHWSAVKSWEIHREWGLEDTGPQVYPDYGEARTWLGQQRPVFDLAPHIAGRNDTFDWQSDLVGAYFSTAWYETQLVVNAGNVEDSHPIAPVDWNYQPSHVTGLGKKQGPNHPARYLLTFAKMNQVFAHPEVGYSDGNFGVVWPQAHPGRYHPGLKDFYDETPDAALVEMIGPVLLGFLDRIEAIPPGDWPRRQDTDGDGQYCDEDWNLLKPASWNGDVAGDCATDWSDSKFVELPNISGRHAEFWYHMIPEFRAVGFPESTLTRMIDWGEAMWPLGNWEALRVDSGPMKYQLPLESGWSTVALPVAPANADMALLVGNLENLVVVKDAAGRVYMPGYGVQDLSVWDPTQAYQIMLDGLATLTVVGVPLDPTNTPIQLDEGWNLLPYFLNTPLPVEDALGSILEYVQYVEDDDGRTFNPATGTNTIGALMPGRGYVINLSQAVTFVYPAG